MRNKKVEPHTARTTEVTVEHLQSAIDIVAHLIDEVSDLSRQLWNPSETSATICSFARPGPINIVSTRPVRTVMMATARKIGISSQCVQASTGENPQDQFSHFRNGERDSLREQKLITFRSNLEVVLMRFRCGTKL